MVRLHGSDDVELGEARDIGAGQVLRVLDTQAAVTWAVILLDALVEIEDGAIGAIADGVDGDLQAGLVGPLDVSVHLVGFLQFVTSKTTRGGRIIVGRTEPCSGRAESSIGEGLESADLNEPV